MRIPRRIMPVVRCMRICLCGPTGSGKTAFAKAFSFRPETTVIEESVPPDLLHLFHCDPKTHCFRLERAIIEGRRAQAQDCDEGGTLIIDRTVSEDIAIFVQLHFEQDLLS